MSVTTSEALNLILNHTSTVKKTELIDIENASSRISAQTIKAKISLPKFNNSAMDGYAILLSDAGRKVAVVDKIFAGESKHPVLEENSTIKIMTGAKIPQNTQAIVPQEDVEVLESGEIILPNDIKKNQHIRFIGEDVSVDDTIVNINNEINYATISLLASQGISKIEVYARPKVAVFASGEELRPHFEEIEPHQIYNSNSPTLISRCKELGCNATFIGSAKDNLEDIKQHISKSLDYDLIVTSGGVSVGEADFTKEAFDSFDIEYIFDGITIKPGKPTIFGKIDDTLVLNLVGNPLASQLIFELFGKVIIQKLSGSNNTFHNTIQAKLQEDLSNKQGRHTIIPGHFDGEYFTPSKKRNPGMVSILNCCNAIIILNKDVKDLSANATVNVLPLNWKFFTNKEKDFLTYAI